MMNTNGLMELIVINMGYVIMAVFTTYMTTPLLRRLIRSTGLEPYFPNPSSCKDSALDWPNAGPAPMPATESVTPRSDTW